MGSCLIGPQKVTSVQFSSVTHSVMSNSLQIPWTAACQASLSITNSRSLLKLMSIELVMPSSHLILCHPLLLSHPYMTTGKTIALTRQTFVSKVNVSAF